MGSAPQSKAARRDISTSLLVRVISRTATLKFRHVGTSAMPVQQLQLLLVQSYSPASLFGLSDPPLWLKPAVNSAFIPTPHLSWLKQHGVQDGQDIVH